MCVNLSRSLGGSAFLELRPLFSATFWEGRHLWNLRFIIFLSLQLELKTVWTSHCTSIHSLFPHYLSCRQPPANRQPLKRRFAPPRTLEFYGLVPTMRRYAPFKGYTRRVAPSEQVHKIRGTVEAWSAVSVVAGRLLAVHRTRNGEMNSVLKFEVVFYFWLHNPHVLLKCAKTTSRSFL